MLVRTIAAGVLLLVTSAGCSAFTVPHQQRYCDNGSINRCTAPRTHNHDTLPSRVRPYLSVSLLSSSLSPSEQETMKCMQVSGLSIMMGLFLFLAQPAMAASIDASIYTNDYNDPLHPLCKRHIEVATDGTTFHYSGTAVGPKGDPILRGCTAPEIRQYKLRQGSFDGFVLEDGKISAGDGIHEGIWEPAGSVPTTIPYSNIDGIRWNDGNKWTVVTKPVATAVGEAIFYAYIGFSTLAGVKGLYDGIMRKKREAEDQLV